MSDETQDSYSPYVAKMVGVDPEAIRSGQMSLTQLGRQALGGDSPEYQAAQAQIKAAQSQLDKALQSRQSGLDPKMLALAAGLFQPGGGGFFGGLSQGLKGYSEAANQQALQDQAIAKMQMDLANQNLAQQQMFAQTGMKVASSLAPKVTELQKQVMAEGLDPNSDAGRTRVKELMATKEATPEMKAFAAQSGLSLVDPNFAKSFKTYTDNKPLQEIALRLNLNLDDPDHLGIVRREFNREKTLSQMSPDLKKKIESLGGDPTDPKVAAQAALMLAKEEGLNEQSKQAQIRASNAAAAASNVAVQRGLQEISENARTGNTDAIVNKATDLRVPVPDTTRYLGLTPKEAAAQRVKDGDATRDYIDKNVSPQMKSLNDDITSLNRAKMLATMLPTGTMKAGVEAYRNYFSGKPEAYQEFEKLANSNVLSATGGSLGQGISNADRDYLSKTTFGVNTVPEANLMIINTRLAQRERDKQYQDFLTNFASVGGTVPEATKYFQKYADANPIMVKDKTGNWVPNPNRQTPEQYFSAPRKNYDKNGNVIP